MAVVILRITPTFWVRYHELVIDVGTDTCLIATEISRMRIALPSNACQHIVIRFIGSTGLVDLGDGYTLFVTVS